MVSVLLLADDPATRTLVRWLLERALPVRVVAATGDDEEAVRLACELRPDLVLIDLAMLRRDRAATIRCIRAQPARTRVVVLTPEVVDDAERVLEGLGADAAIPRELLMARLRRAAWSPLVSA